MAAELEDLIRQYGTVVEHPWSDADMPGVIWLGHPAQRSARTNTSPAQSKPVDIASDPATLQREIAEYLQLPMESSTVTKAAADISSFFAEGWKFENP